MKASFHDVATRKYCRQISISENQIKLIESPSFNDLGIKLSQKETDFSLMAIENSIAGSILPNYAILEKYGFKIQGEIFLRTPNPESHAPAQP